MKIREFWIDELMYAWVEPKKDFKTLRVIDFSSYSEVLKENAILKKENQELRNNPVEECGHLFIDAETEHEGRCIKCNYPMKIQWVPNK